MSMSAAKQSVATWSTIVVVAAVFAPHRALCAPPPSVTPPQASVAARAAAAEDSTSQNPTGVIEITTSVPALSCEQREEQFEKTRERVDEDRAASKAARFRLVNEHLRFIGDPSAMLNAELDEENLHAQRAELRAAKHELRQAEDQLPDSGCDGAMTEPQPDVRKADATSALPASDAPPLAQAPGAGSRRLAEAHP